MEENGGSLIAIHGRTKEQSYAGLADWDAVAEVKSLVKIPVIGSGDIRLVADIERMKKHSGCDAVMIGRGAIVNPWIFSGLDREQVPPDRCRRRSVRILNGTSNFTASRMGRDSSASMPSNICCCGAWTVRSRKKILQPRPSGEFLALVNEMYAAAQ